MNCSEFIKELSTDPEFAKGCKGLTDDQINIWGIFNYCINVELENRCPEYDMICKCGCKDCQTILQKIGEAMSPHVYEIKSDVVQIPFVYSTAEEQSDVLINFAREVVQYGEIKMYEELCKLSDDPISKH